ncbi:MAG: tRNA adenosine(34) deaminase TadA [Deltaproteobacteria bacterium]|nr:tRNA adenosine(34) deaminase TadA [Deltaproteobacteria bacterium]
MALDLYHLMEQALQQAQDAFLAGEVPVGAVVADETGRVLGRGRNQSITLNDPTAHAEIQAMRAASQAVENYRLPGSVLVVTLEPCVMCMGAAIQARIAHLVFGAHDPKAGGAESLYHIGRDKRLNHEIKITAGIMAEDCGALLKNFFRARRQRKN